MDVEVSSSLAQAAVYASIITAALACGGQSGPPVPIPLGDREELSIAAPDLLGTWDIEIEITWRDGPVKEGAGGLGSRASGTITISQPTRWTGAAPMCFSGTHDMPLDSIVLRYGRGPNRIHGCVRPDERRIVAYMGGGLDAGEVYLYLSKVGDSLRGVIGQSFLVSRGGQGTVVMHRRRPPER